MLPLGQLSCWNTLIWNSIYFFNLAISTINLDQSLLSSLFTNPGYHARADFRQSADPPIFDPSIHPSSSSYLIYIWGWYSNEVFNLVNSIARFTCGMQFGTVRFPTLYSIYILGWVQSPPGALYLRDKTLATYATQNGHPLTGPEFSVGPGGT